MRYRPVTPLRPGETVAVIAPSGRPEPESLDLGLALLSERYQVSTYRDLTAAPFGMHAGVDPLRAAELRWALTRPEHRAVIAARGGYGTARIVAPELGTLLADGPRLLVGFSDITVLLSVALRQAGLRAVHGPMVCQVGRRGKAALDPLVALLEGARPAPADQLERLAPGRAVGPLVGGNLTVLTHLVGTPWLPSLSGALLFVEDVDERPYRLDRCLVHLRQAGALDGLAGLVVGDLTLCSPRGGEATAGEVFERFAAELAIPAALGLTAGHGPINRPLPLGARAELDADAGTLTFLEGVASHRRS